MEVAKKMGANQVYNALEEKELVARLLDDHNGLGADVVVELSGAPSAMKNAFGAVRKGGRVTLFGLSPAPVEQFDFNYNIILRQITVHGVAGAQVTER